MVIVLCWGKKEERRNYSKTHRKNPVFINLSYILVFIFIGSLQYTRHSVWHLGIPQKKDTCGPFSCEAYNLKVNIDNKQTVKYGISCGMSIKKHI